MVSVHFQVPLPTHMTLPQLSFSGSRSVAIKQFESVERKLNSSSVLRWTYFDEFILMVARPICPWQRHWRNKSYTCKVRKNRTRIFLGTYVWNDHKISIHKGHYRKKIENIRGSDNYILLIKNKHTCSKLIHSRKFRTKKNSNHYRVGVVWRQKKKLTRRYSNTVYVLWLKQSSLLLAIAAIKSNSVSLSQKITVSTNYTYIYIVTKVYTSLSKTVVSLG